jgi:hypothetical protein
MPETTPDVNVTLSQPDKSMSRWQWISVVGVGTVLIVGIVPWMMNMIGGNQEFFETTIQQNTTALTKVAEQGDDVERAIRSNTRALNKLAEVVGPDEDDEEPTP